MRQRQSVRQPYEKKDFRYGNGQPYPAAGATGSETEKRERDITKRK